MLYLMDRSDHSLAGNGIILERQCIDFPFTYTYGTVASEITQLPSLQQFKTKFKSMLLSSYL